MQSHDKRHSDNSKQKKEKRMNYDIKRKIYPLAVLLALTACSQDDEPGGNTLPEGKYPLEIASVTMDVADSEQPWCTNAPQTRVAETADGTSSTWSWDGTERIGVQLYADVATYTLNTDRTLTADKTLYWKDTKNTTCTAWYPAYEGESGTVSLADQSEKLAYVLKGSGEGNYNTPVVLAFSHALAKVRVVFSEGSTADLTNASVSILAPTTCTVDKGNVTAGATIGYIPMHETTYNDGKVCWEANVTPNLTLKDNAFQLVIDGMTVNCSTTEVLTQAGQLHVITLTVNEKGTVVNVSDIIGSEYTVSGNVHLKGDGTARDLKLIMKDGAKLTIENVNLDLGSRDNAITCKGNAIITLKGSNSLVGKYTGGDKSYSGILVERGTLIINGGNNAKLIAGDAICGIGATNGAHITIIGGYIVAGPRSAAGLNVPGIGSAGWNQTCGNITINGGIIESWGGSFSAGIGGAYRGACGDIIITGGNIKAYGGMQSPGIGNGRNASCGNITISGANTVVYAKKGWSSDSPNPVEPIGWNNYNGSCGTVTIGPECTVTQE